MRVVYGKDQISYSTADAVAPAAEVLRLSYLLKSITADGKPLESQKAISANGYVAGGRVSGLLDKDASKRLDAGCI